MAMPPAGLGRTVPAFQYCGVGVQPFPVSSIDEAAAEPGKSAVVFGAVRCNARAALLLCGAAQWVQGFITSNWRGSPGSQGLPGSAAAFWIGPRKRRPTTLTQSLSGYLPS